MRASTIASLVVLGSLASPALSRAQFVLLQQPTATFSQSSFGDFSVQTAINGTDADGLGWAIDPQEGQAQIAVFETAQDGGFASGSLLSFTLTQVFGNFHTVGRFRLSVTTDDRSTFADGLASGGDVTANWTVLQPSTLLSANGATLALLGDNSILVSGSLPSTDTYTIAAQTTLTGITGVRLEVLTDPSLPFNGPGRQPSNGNLTLSEFTLNITAIPEPATNILLAFGALILIVTHRHRSKR